MTTPDHAPRPSYSLLALLLGLIAGSAMRINHHLDRIATALEAGQKPEADR